MLEKRRPCTLLGDTAIIVRRVLVEVRLPADEFNGDIQITNSLAFADIAPKYHCLLD